MFARAQRRVRPIAQARLDLIRASVGLAGMASSANRSTVDLGGKTLASRVYTVTARPRKVTPSFWTRSR
jgi:hypothetical protein